jgi:hypothetical protein
MYVSSELARSFWRMVEKEDYDDDDSDKSDEDDYGYEEEEEEEEGQDEYYVAQLPGAWAE